MRKSRFWIPLAAAIVLAAGQARAQGTVVLGTEDPILGFTGPLVGPAPAILVGSDGDLGPFTPFGLTFPVSDAIVLNGNWRYIGPAGWTQLPGTFVWYLLEPPGPDPVVEPIGHWEFIPGSSWLPGTPEFQHILEPDGSLSDIIRLFNGPNGANITFQSGISAVPEPGSVVLLVSGLAAIGVVRRRRRSV